MTPSVGGYRGSPARAGLRTPKTERRMRMMLWAAVVATAVVAAGGRAEDEKVPLDRVPAAIKDAVKAKYPKAEIVSVEKGDVDGTKVYEFKLKEGAKEWEAAFTPDAKFHSSEEPLAAADLPAKVKDAFAKKYGDAKIVSAEKETTGEGDKAKVVYEIIFEKGKDKLEAQFDPEGKFLGEEKVQDKKDDEKAEKVPLDKLPKAVADAVKAKFPKAELKGAEKGKKDGKTKYEVTVQDGASKIDVDVTEDGTITGYEKEVALKDLPKVVSEAVATKYPKGTPKSAEVVYTVKDGKDTLAYYEVIVDVDGKTVEVEVLADGKLKPEEKKEDKKDT